MHLAKEAGSLATRPRYQNCAFGNVSLWNKGDGECSFVSISRSYRLHLHITLLLDQNLPLVEHNKF